MHPRAWVSNVSIYLEFDGGYKMKCPDCYGTGVGNTLYACGTCGGTGEQRESVRIIYTTTSPLEGTDLQKIQATLDLMLAELRQLSLAQTTAPVSCCPVCGGNGLVDAGFYSQTSGTWTTSSTAPEPCRACDGKGIIR